LPTILSTLFRWPVTVRNFPTPCKIQGNCNPFVFTHIPNPKIKGICNFLAHNSQACSSTCPCIERANPKLPKANSITKGKQACAHALREPISSYPQRRLNHQGKSTPSSTKLLRWDGAQLMMTSVHSLQLLLHHLLASET
jgi:hypothetical protein